MGVPNHNELPHTLLYANDPDNKVKFLIDSGAAISVIPSSRYAKFCKTPEESYLYAANGSKIHTYGSQFLVVNIGLRRNFPFVFMIADVKTAIIGADFLSKYGLCIDLANRKITDPQTQISVTMPVIKSESTQISVNNCSAHLEILAKYPSLTRVEDKVPEIKHNFKHYIPTNGTPPSFRPRKLNPKMLKIAKEKMEKMLQDGIVRPSDSQFASPLHIVPKRKDWRLVGDYRALNSQTKKDCYPLPYLQDFSLQLHNKKYFSKIDLKDAYHQIPIAEEDVHKTNITTPFGAFEYTRMSFGLCGAAQTFQRFIDCVLRNLRQKDSQEKITTFAYLDDIIIASDDEVSHVRDLEALFERLVQYNIKINLPKCQFSQKSIEFLGHEVSDKGIKPLPDKVSAINDFPLPETYKQLRRFIGMVNYYKRFIKDAANILAPLYDLLAGYKKLNRNRLIKWSNSQIEAFSAAKTALANVTYLSYPARDVQLGLFCDASGIAVGSVLQQFYDNSWHPIGFYSNKLTKRERLGSAFARELLAIYKSFKYFHHFLEGNDIVIFTDHKPLIGALDKPLDRQNPVEARQLSFIAQFCPKIEHIAGQTNVVADTLSRPQIDCISTIVSLDHVLKDELISEQKRDQEIKDLLK